MPETEPVWEQNGNYDWSFGPIECASQSCDLYLALTSRPSRPDSWDASLRDEVGRCIVDVPCSLPLNEAKAQAPELVRRALREYVAEIEAGLALAETAHAK